jgi:hypothetical protein
LRAATILDIGANRGQFAVVARQTFPGAAILAFEPLDNACLCLPRCPPWIGRHPSLPPRTRVLASADWPPAGPVLSGH